MCAPQIEFKIEFSVRVDEKLEAVAGRTNLHENDHEEPSSELNNLASANKSGNILMLG